MSKCNLQFTAGDLECMNNFYEMAKIVILLSNTQKVSF